MAVYRSAMGKPVDMSAIVSQNEKTRAVGNMNVNARGDILDSNNRVIQDNTKRVRTNYNKTVQAAQPAPEPVVEEATQIDRAELTPEEQMFEDDDEDIVKE